MQRVPKAPREVRGVRTWRMRPSRQARAIPPSLLSAAEGQVNGPAAERPAVETAKRAAETACAKPATRPTTGRGGRAHAGSRARAASTRRTERNHSAAPSVVRSRRNVTGPRRGSHRRESRAGCRRREPPSKCAHSPRLRCWARRPCRRRGEARRADAVVDLPGARTPRIATTRPATRASWTKGSARKGCPRYFQRK